MTARDDLAATIYAYTPLMTVVQDGHRLADAIIKAGWVPAAEVKRLREEIVAEIEAHRPDLSFIPHITARREGEDVGMRRAAHIARNYETKP